MKKLVLSFVIIASTGLMFTSCKKDYHCKCNVSIGDTSSIISFSIDTTIDLGKQSKKDAKNSCNAYSNDFGANTTAVTGGCSLD